MLLCLCVCIICTSASPNVRLRLGRLKSVRVRERVHECVCVYVCNERLHGCRKFVFTRGTLISSQPDVTFPYDCSVRVTESAHSKARAKLERDETLLIKNPKERGPDV